MTKKAVSIADSFGMSVDSRKYKTTNALVLPDTWLGIELEIENINGVLKHVRNAGVNYPNGGGAFDARVLNTGTGRNLWIVEQDGSLRDGGLELKSIPIFGLDVLTALNDLEKFFNEHDFKPKFSRRTSVHIHINVLDMDYEQ